MTEAGLLVVGKKISVPLKDASVRAHISGYLVGLESTLKYTNEGGDPIEVVFRFPLEESFAVVGLEAVLGGRKIKAEIREKEEARQMYDDAIASGSSAALAEEKTGDIFSVSLGNLPPKADAELHLKMVGELPIDAEGAVRFALPSVLKPRYTPSGSTDPLEKVGGADARDQVQQASAPAVFSFQLEVASSGVSSVTSPTHGEEVQTETKGSVIHLSLCDKPLQKDLVVLVHRKQPHEPWAMVENGDESVEKDSMMQGPVVMLNFFPEFSSSRAACEFVFVVDRSGSMGGAFIKSASETLVLFLKSIPPGCHFNIIGFGSSYQSLFPESVPYNQKNLDKAVQHAEHLQADLGGTELLAPLKYVFKQKALSGLPRQVFVLTDGSVSNTNACIEEVKRNAGSARCFTFGIGSGASTALVKGLARAGNGTSEFIQSGERLQPKVIRSLKQALQPSVTDLKISFTGIPSGLSVTQAPTRPPTVFNGEKTVMYAILKGQAQLFSPVDCIATLKGQMLDKLVEFSVPFQLPGTSPTFSLPILHHLAAKSLIKGWEEEGHSKKADIIKLSISASVVSSHTAFIAIDEEQNKPIQGAMKTWDIKADMLELDSIGFSSACFAAPPPGAMLQSRAKKSGGFRFGGLNLLGKAKKKSKAPPPRSYEAMAAPVLCSSLDRASSDSDDEEDDMCLGAPLALESKEEEEMECESAPMPALSRSKAAPSKPTKAKPSGTLTSIISLQQAEGSWKLDEALAQALGKKLKELESACPVKCDDSGTRTIWATTLALEFLKAKHSSQEDEWELVAMKAEMWLSQQTLPAGADFKAAAKKCF